MKMVQLDVGRDGNVWGVATDGLVYRRMGITVDPPTHDSHKGTHWEQVVDDQTGAVVKVDMCTTGRVWALRQNGDVNDVQFREGVSIRDTVGSHWSNVEGTMLDISCGFDGQVWAISTGGAMYIRDDVSYSRPKGTGWDLVDSDTRYRSVGVGSENHQIWAVKDDFHILMRTGVSNRNQKGDGWVEVDGYLSQVSVGNWHVWGVSRFNELFERTEVSGDKAIGEEWLQRESYMAYVSTAEEGIVWSLDEKGEVWILKSGSISIDDTVPNGELGWTHAPDALLVQVDVGYNSQVAGVDDQGAVYWRTGITDGVFGGEGWMTIDDSPAMHHVTVCDTGVFWGNTAEH
jgi:hypothetical protein